MSRGVNKAMILGHVGNKKIHHANGNTIAKLSIATNETWKDKATGEEQKRTEWHNCVFFKGVAGVVEKYVNVGDKVFVEGQLRTNKHVDNAGVEKYYTEIIVNDLHMLGSSGDTPKRSGPPVEAYGGDYQGAKDSLPSNRALADDDLGDIPF